MDVDRKRNWDANCWLDSAHSDIFPSIARGALRELVANLDTELKNIENAYKHDKTTTVMPVVINGHPYVLKRYNARSIWHRVKRALRVSRAQRCWCMAFHFQRAGLNVAKPILMVEDRIGPITKDAYLLNSFLDGPELLTQLPKMDDTEKLVVKSAVKEAFQKMYKHRLTHGDMKASNLLWVNGQLFFIDLDAAKKHRSRLTWRHSNAKDKMRFLKNWRDHPELLNLFSEYN